MVQYYDRSGRRVSQETYTSEQLSERTTGASTGITSGRMYLDSQETDNPMDLADIAHVGDMLEANALSTEEKQRKEVK